MIKTLFIIGIVLLVIAIVDTYITRPSNFSEADIFVKAVCLYITGVIAFSIINVIYSSIKK